MNVEFKNLGFVKNIELNLDKNLIVLCGPNNSGKTYVAYALYGLMKYKSQVPTSKKIISKIKNLFEEGQIDIDIKKLLENDSENFLELISKSYIERISGVFAAEKINFNKFDLNLKLNNINSIIEKLTPISIQQEIGVRNSFTIKIFKEENSHILTCLLINRDSKATDYKSEIPTNVVLEVISDRIFDIITNFVFPNTYIAPAERIAINIFSKELSLKRNILVDKLLDLKQETNDDPLDLVKRRATRYPLPIRDSLEIAEDLNNFKKNTSEFENLANEIETEILKGQVLISKEGDVQFKPDKAKSLKLPIHLTASIVKSLSSLVIYFRHIAKRGDFIIIDEPELNLHPDNQVIIARIIAKIVNSNFKVLISTHSDYIVRELNNLIMLSNNQQLVEKYNISRDTLLDYKKIDAILFNYNQRKTSKIEISQTGFEVETIDNVVNNLNNIAQELYFTTEFDK